MAVFLLKFIFYLFIFFSNWPNFTCLCVKGKKKVNFYKILKDFILFLTTFVFYLFYLLHFCYYFLLIFVFIICDDFYFINPMEFLKKCSFPSVLIKKRFSLSPQEKKMFFLYQMISLFKYNFWSLCFKRLPSNFHFTASNSNMHTLIDIYAYTHTQTFYLSSSYTCTYIYTHTII